MIQEVFVVDYDRNTFYTFEARGYTDYLLYAEIAPANCRLAVAASQFVWVG